MWDFETDPEFQAKLDWADAFVREEVEPLDQLWRGLEFTPPSDTLRRRRCGMICAWMSLRALA